MALNVAGSARSFPFRGPVVGPEDMAAAIAEGKGRTAILFGPERSGLETEEVALANAIVTVPINPEFGSLNLAQAGVRLVETRRE